MERLRCGGGGVMVADSVTAEFTDTEFRSNSCGGSGGALLIAGEAAVTVTRCSFLGNAAGEDGGALAALNTSSLHAERFSAEANSAHFRGGGIFANNKGATFTHGCAFSSNTAVSTGGALFMFSPVELSGNPDDSEAWVCGFRDNTAAIGGAIAASGAVATLSVATAGHVLKVENNTAHLHGGGVALSSGALLQGREEICEKECRTSWRGDGECHPECMTRACAWDDGDCAPLFLQAGARAAVACDRAQCSLAAHVFGPGGKGNYKDAQGCDKARQHPT